MNMDKGFKDLVRYKLMRAQETLDDARILFDKDRLFSAVNRIYYAMFYSVNALLLIKNLSSAKHSGVMGLFNKEFVNKGLVKKEMGKFYNEIFEFRQKADYKDWVNFEKEEVRVWLEKTGEFLYRIELLVKRLNKSFNIK